MKKKLSNIELHVAGATVRHESIFENLVSYRNDTDLSPDFINKWVAPYYLNLKKVDEGWIQKMIALKGQITDDVILRSLGDFNWRSRSTGAYFASIKGETRFTEIIGIHLVKSEVAFAGGHYAITLASFNTAPATEFLNKYLDYYLKRTDLDFDQPIAMSAIKYLDQLNGTDFADRHSLEWNTFRQHKIEEIKKSVGVFKGQESEAMATAYEGHLKFWQEDISPKPVADALRVINRIKTEG